MDSAPIQSELPRRPLRPQELERLKQRALEEPVPDLSTTDRRGVSLRGMNLCGANLRNADLTGADLEDANVDGADFREAIITADKVCAARNWPMAHFIVAILNELGLPSNHSARIESGNFDGYDFGTARLNGLLRRNHR